MRYASTKPYIFCADLTSTELQKVGLGIQRVNNECLIITTIIIQRAVKLCVPILSVVYVRAYHHHNIIMCVFIGDDDDD